MSRSHFVLPRDVPVAQLECSEAFHGLAENEKKYAHYLSRACYEGGLIVLVQTSPESPAIFMLLQMLFRDGAKSVQENANKKLHSDITEEDMQALFTYAAGFYSNMGNYKSFGDTKIVPGLEKDKFQAIVWASESFKSNSTQLEQLWHSVNDAMYSLKPRFRELGIASKGLSTYYSSNITEDDIGLVGEFMLQKDISPYNTRLFKEVDGDTVKYNLRLASVLQAESGGSTDSVFPLLNCQHSHQGRHIIVTRGDYSSLMKRVVINLNKAKAFAANEHECSMIENYIDSFTTGSMDSHKDGSRHWIRDKGPIVENYIGFIETYRDPYGVRGEFEGFVAVVNKEMSRKFGVLVDRAEHLLTQLPWPAAYEKDNFLRPDFTSLEVLSFAGSGIPAGINIPNYDDVRQNEGFKNVSLGNVVNAVVPDKPATFLSAKDQALFKKWKGPSFEVQVGLHELLGHGSGKLFQQAEDGKLNFDIDSVKHLITNEKISSWYGSSETWDSKFAAMSSTYEECRAECVGLHLCLSDEVLQIFGHSGDDAEEVLYVNWLNMVRAGLCGLEFFSPETSSWKQAHMQARYVILQVLLEANDDLVKIEQMIGEDGNPDLRISIDQQKIKSTGRVAIANFLMKLQLYKATADLENGQKMYNGYSAVSTDFLSIRETVIARKQERRLFVQAHTEIKGDCVELSTFESSSSGLIDSYVTRFPNHDSELEQIWIADQARHEYAAECADEDDLM